MQEFPKMLYSGDEYVIVADADEEAEQRANGYALYGEVVEEEVAAPRRGRPPKAVEAVVEPVVEEAADAGDS